MQQDWYGMGQLFHYRGAGATVFGNRPSTLPAVLGEVVHPDETGWSYYLGNSAFAASSSPVEGVRQLDPGERVTGVADTRGGWRFTSETRRGFDELVAEALDGSPPFDVLAAEIADGVRRVARSLASYWPGSVTLGLSGGKDSRLIAAALVSAGMVPRFTTNKENPVEGDTARRLTTLLRERRGVEVDHRFYVATRRNQVFALGVDQRARVLQRRHDFMFASTYLNRPVSGAPANLGAPSLTGALGECITNVWLPAEWTTEPQLATRGGRDILRAKLTRIVPAEALRPAARDRLDALVDELCARAEHHGLDPFGTITYGYLLGRMRRSCTALTNIGQVMPLVIPEVFRAGFLMTPQQKANRMVHNAVIAELVPEWRAVPFVSYRTGVQPSDILRIWHGAGEADLAGLLARPTGLITSLFETRTIADALRRATDGHGGNREDALLRQFAMAATADQAFDKPSTHGRFASMPRRAVANGHPQAKHVPADVSRAWRDSPHALADCLRAGWTRVRKGAPG